MAISKEKLEQVLESYFNDGLVEVIDLAGDDDHYEVRITSAIFQDLSMIEQHRKVYDAVAKYDLHALKIKTYVKQ